jgi:hypothetical protein
VYWRDMKAYNEQLALAEGKPPPLDPFEVRPAARRWSARRTQSCTAQTRPIYHLQSPKCHLSMMQELERRLAGEAG